MVNQSILAPSRSSSVTSASPLVPQREQVSSTRKLVVSMLTPRAEIPLLKDTRTTFAHERGKGKG